MYSTILNSDKRKKYLDLAFHISTWSKDPSTKVGAVLMTLDGKVASTGYNGLPYSADDSKIHDRDFKIKNVIHAEMNAIANRYFLNEPCILFVSHPMCTDCVKLVTAHKFIHGVCWANNQQFSERWNTDQSEEMLARHFNNVIEIGQYDETKTCTYIFKKEDSKQTNKI